MSTAASWVQPHYQFRLLAAHWRRFARFGLIGALGVIVNTVLLALLVEVGHLRQLPATALATEAVIVLNFVLNDHWTFRDARPHHSWAWRASRYNLIALGGLVLTLGIMAVLSLELGMEYLLANLVAIGVTVLWNYTLNARFTWVLPSSPTAGAAIATVAPDSLSAQQMLRLGVAEATVLEGA